MKLFISSCSCLALSLRLGVEMNYRIFSDYYHKYIDGLAALIRKRNQCNVINFLQVEGDLNRYVVRLLFLVKLFYLLNFGLQLLAAFVKEFFFNFKFSILRT